MESTAGGDCVSLCEGQAKGKPLRESVEFGAKRSGAVNNRGRRRTQG